MAAKLTNCHYHELWSQVIWIVVLIDVHVSQVTVECSSAKVGHCGRLTQEAISWLHRIQVNGLMACVLRLRCQAEGRWPTHLYQKSFMPPQETTPTPFTRDVETTKKHFALACVYMRLLITSTTTCSSLSLSLLKFFWRWSFFVIELWRALALEKESFGPPFLGLMVIELVSGFLVFEWLFSGVLFFLGFSFSFWVVVVLRRKLGFELVREKYGGCLDCGYWVLSCCFPLCM